MNNCYKLLGLLSVTALVACGGSDNVNSNTVATASGQMTNTVAAAATELSAGSKTAISAMAEARNGAPTSMIWSIIPLSGAGGATPTFSDPTCQTATISQPYAAVTTGDGVCNGILVIPLTTFGTWRVTNTASASVGTVSSFTDISVSAMQPTGFQLTESPFPLAAYVGKPVALSLPYTANPGATIQNVSYQWAAATSNPATLSIIGANANKTSVSVVPTVPGWYQFNATASALVNNLPQTTTGTVIVQVFPVNPAAAALNVSAPQVVSSGAIVTLAGAIGNKDTAVTYSPTWSQQASDTVKVALANANSGAASFIAPSAGTYNFTWTVVSTFADGKTATTSTQTSVVVK